MSSLFSPNSKFSIFMTRVFDLFVLNMLFLLSSIPFVTIGTASTSVYYITLKMAAGTDTYIVKPYFKVFKENFKKSTIVWCITALIGVVLLMDFHLETYIPGTFRLILHYIFVIITVLYVFYLTYVFPLMAKFENTVKNSMKNALLISVLNFPYTFMMLCLTIGPALIAIYSSTAVFNYFFLYLLFFGFSVPAFFSSVIFDKKVFPKYLPEEEADEEQNEKEEADN